MERGYNLTRQDGPGFLMKETIWHSFKHHLAFFQAVIDAIPIKVGELFLPKSFEIFHYEIPSPVHFI